MDTDARDIASPVVKTTRRDSGLFAYFDIKPSSQRRESGLNINDFDKESICLTTSDDDENDTTYFKFPVVEELVVRESGSPINKSTNFSYEESDIGIINDKENYLDKSVDRSIDSSTIGTTCDFLTGIESPKDQNVQFETTMLKSVSPRSDKTEENLQSESRVLLQKNLNVKEKSDNTSKPTGKPPRPNSGKPNSSTSRVDVLLKSDLFKKYLSKHEALIDKISVRQGRGNGLKKALSNLDISKLDFGDGDDACEEKNLNSSCSFNDKSLQNDWENTPSIRTRRNTYSEADFNPAPNTGEKDQSDNQKVNESCNGRSSKSSRRTRHRFSIPSFEEFKNSKFKQIPEEGAYEDDDEESCENCDKNRTLENEKKKSRSHSRCQRIKEKNSQNHDKQLTCKSSNSSVDGKKVSRVLPELPVRQNEISEEIICKSVSDSDLKSVNMEQKKLRRSEIPIRIKSSSLVPAPKQCISGPVDSVLIADNAKNPALTREENNTTQNSPSIQKSKNGLPPRHSSEKRVILRASRKRKIGQKKPFKRSQSDSQLETKNSSSKELTEEKKCKPPPLDINMLNNVDNVSEISSSPMYSASTLNDTDSPASATMGAFDFSAEVVKNYELAFAEEDENSSTVAGLCDVIRDDNVCDKKDDLSILEPNIELIEKENPSAIANVELWSDDTDKQIETLSTTSECSNRLSEESNVYDSSQNKCILNDTDSLPFHDHFDSTSDLFSLDTKSSVTRSTSDVCNSTTLDALKKRRERKERPYKSDPFTGSLHLPAAKPKSTSSNKDEVFEIDEISLEEVEEEDEKVSILSDEDWKTQHRLSDISVDSGVIGPDCPSSPTSTVFSTSSSLWSADITSSGTNEDKIVGGCTSPRFKILNGCKDCGNLEGNGKTKCCSKCEKRSVERKAIILEIKETEASYGRDLIILKEHFYKPMKSTGLLSLEHLEGIFLNLDELIHVNTQFVKKLQSAVDMATKRGDENLKTVSIGNLFLDSSSLMLAFENYCVNQGQATALLEQLEKEKELLRIFLKVSQDENQLLRRMPMNSFLMVPVQRIMRYPLLLERLYKFTSGDHSDKSALMEAKLKIEDILDHINSKTKHGGTIKLKRKVSDTILQRISITEKIELNKVAIEVLGWNRKEVCDISICRLQVAPLLDQTWASKRLKTLKLTMVHCVLLTLGQNDSEISDVSEDGLLYAKKSNVIQAAVVLIKEKNGKYQTFREPFMLNRCIASVDPEVDDTFELSDLNREPFLFKGEDSNELKSFLQAVKQQTLNLGTWRRRRNALPNIMIKHMI